jgi:hypothetical protein
MNLPVTAAIPHPDPLPVPAPHPLLWFLLVLTFFLHLLPMNFILGGSILALVSRIRSKTHNGHRLLAGFFARSVPIITAATITMGVAPLLLTQVLYGRLFFSSSVLMAWSWAAVIPLLIVGYFSTYRVAFKPGGPARIAGWLAAICFVAIGFLYSNNFTLMLQAQDLPARYAADPSGRQLNLIDPTLAPRFLHMLVGALAVAGLIVTLYGLYQRKTNEATSRWTVRYGAIWFTVATGINVILGGWWLMALPRETMLRFMGGNMTATAALVIGTLAGLATLVMMTMAVNARNTSRLVRAAAAHVLVTLVAMILCRDQVRRGALAGVGFENNAWVETQWGPLVLFVILLVVAIGTVIWMVRRLALGR